MLGMTGLDFCNWLGAMKGAKIIVSDADAARLLDVSSNTVVTMKKEGADRRTALACRALYHNMQPWFQHPPQWD